VQCSVDTTNGYYICLADLVDVLAVSCLEFFFVCLKWGESFVVFFRAVRELFFQSGRLKYIVLSFGSFGLSVTCGKLFMDIVFSVEWTNIYGSFDWFFQSFCYMWKAIRGSFSFVIVLEWFFRGFFLGGVAYLMVTRC
jgi:hypothetical protein